MGGLKQKTPGGLAPRVLKSGSVLLSQDLAVQVSSALVDLTSVFGMGTGVTPPASPPENIIQSDEIS